MTFLTQFDAYQKEITRRNDFNFHSHPELTRKCKMKTNTCDEFYVKWNLKLSEISMKIERPRGYI